MYRVVRIVPLNKVVSSYIFQGIKGNPGFLMEILLDRQATRKGPRQVP